MSVKHVCLAAVNKHVTASRVFLQLPCLCLAYPGFSGLWDTASPDSFLKMLLLLSLFSHVWLCNPIDISPPGSPDPGILQARTLQWVAISFSNAWKWKVKVKLLSHVWLLVTPWAAAYQAPPFVGFSRKEYWSGLPLPSPKDVCELWPSTTAKISEITMIIIGESKQISWFFHMWLPLWVIFAFNDFAMDWCMHAC